MNKRLFIPLALTFILACSIPGPSAAPPPAQPVMEEGAIETIIVETAAAAQTQTAALLPTATRTPTATFTPSVTPTPTVTFIYNLYTSTPVPSETPLPVFTLSSGQTGTSSDGFKMTDDEWHCVVAAIMPPRNTEFQPGARFSVYWTLFNNGTKTWPYYGVDLVYTGGYRHEGTKIQDFWRTVAPGQKVTVGADFIAPKKGGDYQTFFKLMVGKRMFCGMKYTFSVAEK